MKQVKVIPGLTHKHVESEANKWLAENGHLKILNILQSEWVGSQGRSFTITLFYEEKEKVKAAIPVNR